MSQQPDVSSKSLWKHGKGKKGAAGIKLTKRNGGFYRETPDKVHLRKLLEEFGFNIYLITDPGRRGL